MIVLKMTDWARLSFKKETLVDVHRVMKLMGGTVEF